MKASRGARCPAVSNSASSGRDGERSPVRTTNRKRYEALAYLLARCEEDRRALERRPEVKPLLDRMRASVQAARDHFRGVPLRRRKLPRTDPQQMCLRASLIRMQMMELMRNARLLAAATGIILKLPVLRRSHRHFIEDAESALETMAPLAGALRARGITAHEHLPRQIAFFKAMKAQGRASRKPKTMSAVLTAGWKAAVELKPLHCAMFPTDYNRLYIWGKVRWTGPARAQKRQSVVRSRQSGVRRSR